MDPYPLNGSHLTAYCMYGDWRECKVRLLSDYAGGNDEYYLRTSESQYDAEAWGGSLRDTYTDVTEKAKRLDAEIFGK